MKKVIVTGASGFIGKALTRELIRQGLYVYAIVRNKDKMADLSADNLKIVTLALDEYSNMPQIIHDDIDVFYHLAWDGTFGDSFKNYQKQLENTAFAGDAIMAAVAIKCKKFILAGSIVQLEVEKYIHMDYCEPRNSCVYGTAKMAAEMLCKTLAYNHQIEFNMAIIASVFGVGDYSGMIQNVLLTALSNGCAPKLVEGSNLYDWVYIDDVVEALICMGVEGVNFKTYYVGHRALRTFREIITEVRDIINPAVTLTFGELADITHTDYSLVDLEKLHEDTGFEAKCDFRDSILKTAEWLKQREEEKRMTKTRNALTGGGGGQPPLALTFILFPAWLMCRWGLQYEN